MTFSYHEKNQCRNPLRELNFRFRWGFDLLKKLKAVEKGCLSFFVDYTLIQR